MQTGIEVLKDRAPLGKEARRDNRGEIHNKVNIAHSPNKYNLPPAIGYIVVPPARIRFSCGDWRYLDLLGMPRALVKCPYCGKWHTHGAPDQERPGITRVSHCARGGEYCLVLIGKYEGQVLTGRFG